MIVQPYLMFDGRCEEALAFYTSALDAKVEMMMRFGESPEPCVVPSPSDKIMHASLRIGDSLVMASDGDCKGNTSFQGISLTISVKSEEEADRVFGALSQGGQVHMPLTKTFFSSKFGMLADKFGVSWMVIVDQECGK